MLIFVFFGQRTKKHPNSCCHCNAFCERPNVCWLLSQTCPMAQHLNPEKLWSPLFGGNMRTTTAPKGSLNSPLDSIGYRYPIISTLYPHDIPINQVVWPHCTLNQTWRAGKPLIWFDDFPIQSCMTRSGMFQLAMFDSLRVPLEAKKLSWKRRSKGFHTPQQMPSLETWFTIKNELTLTWREWSPWQLSGTGSFQTI
jgi:hypothetical protein